MRLDGTAETVIAATRERCFAILTDFEAYPDWYGCDRVRVLDADPPVVEMTYEIPLIEVVLALRFHATPPARLEGELVQASAHVKDVAVARWELDPAGERSTRVRYTLDVEMDVPIVLRGVARARGRHLLLDAPARELKERAEAAPSAA